jgi:hypothetical protein
MKKVAAFLLAVAFAALIIQPVSTHVNTHFSKSKALLDGGPIPPFPPPPPPPQG